MKRHSSNDHDSKHKKKKKKDDDQVEESYLLKHIVSSKPPIRKEKDNYTKLLDKVKKQSNKTCLIKNEVNSYQNDHITVSEMIEETKKKRGRKTKSGCNTLSLINQLGCKGEAGIVDFDGEDDEDDGFNEPIPAQALLQSLIRKNDPFLCRVTPSSVSKDYFNDDEEHKLKTKSIITTTTTALTPTTTKYESIKPLITLWDYQEDTLKFIARREQDLDHIGCKGVMLCHDMGLGKTPITLTHILRDNQRKAKITGERFNGPTIILCKTILVPTWKAEIEKSFPQHTFVFYDFTDIHQLDNIQQAHIEKCCDIVFITYSMLLTSFLLKNNTSFTFTTIDDILHKELDEDDFDDPINVDDNGSNTCGINGPGGGGMIKRQKTIEKHDKLKMLFNIKWSRVVTDESQQFVNKKTKLFQAVTALQSDSKWVVSGTPIQNSLDNIYACFEFIGVNDKDYSNMTMINTKNLTKDEENELQLRIKSILSKVMIRLVKSDGLLKKNNVLTSKGIEKKIIYVNFETKLEQLVYLLYASYGLNNLQKMRKTNTSKVMRHINASSSKAKKKDYHNRVTYIIQLMRQLCISFRIVKNLILPKGMLTMGLGNELMLKDTGFNELLFDDDNDDYENKMINSLNDHEDEDHNHCNDLCVFSKSMNKNTIFEYKSGLTSKPELITWNPFSSSKEFSSHNYEDRLLYTSIYQDMKDGIKKDDIIEKYEDISCLSKTNAILNHIDKRTLKYGSTKDIHIINYIKSIEDPTDKVIIFSDYVKALECLSIQLNKEGLKHVIVTGNKVKNSSNNEQLEIFKKDPTVKILLLSLKLGNNGLNLSCANHIIFYSKWWNPHIELQAQDRIIRIGQTKVVHIIYIIIRGTIEEYILKLSNNKKKISANLIKPVDDDQCYNDEDEEEVIQDEDDETCDAINDDNEQKQINKFKDELFNFAINIIRPDDHDR